MYLSLQIIFHLFNHFKTTLSWLVFARALAAGKACKGAEKQQQQQWHKGKNEDI